MANYSKYKSAYQSKNRCEWCNSPVNDPSVNENKSFCDERCSSKYSKFLKDLDAKEDRRPRWTSEPEPIR